LFGYSASAYGTISGLRNPSQSGSIQVAATDLPPKK